MNTVERKFKARQAYIINQEYEGICGRFRPHVYSIIQPDKNLEGELSISTS